MIENLVFGGQIVPFQQVMVLVHRVQVSQADQLYIVLDYAVDYIFHIDALM